MAKQAKTVPSGAVRAGQHLVLGSYGRSHPRPIQFRIADVSERGTTAVSVDVLTVRPFDTSREGMERWIGRACGGYGAKLSPAGLADSPWSNVTWCGWWQRDAFANGHDVTCINDARAVGWEPAASCYAGYRPMIVVRSEVTFTGSGTAKYSYRLA